MKKIMSKNRGNGLKFFFSIFFDHFRNLRQKLHNPTKFQKNGCLYPKLAFIAGGTLSFVIEHPGIKI